MPHGSQIRHWIFGGLNFSAGIFGGFCLSPKGFFGVLIFAHIRSSGHLKSGVGQKVITRSQRDSA